MKHTVRNLQMKSIGFIACTVVLGFVIQLRGTDIAFAVDSPETVALKPDEIPADSLLQGLDTRIIDKLFSTINQMPEDISFSKGKPLAKLDYHYDGTTPMFGTDRNQGIGLVISGFLKFDPSGRYEIRAKSNDGIRVKLADRTIIEDPDIHADRFSSIAVLDVSRSGYVPIRIHYFQRKGSACLELSWKHPGSDHFEIVPEQAYWRPKKP